MALSIFGATMGSESLCSSPSELMITRRGAERCLGFPVYLPGSPWHLFSPLFVVSSSSSPLPLLFLLLPLPSSSSSLPLLFPSSSSPPLSPPLLLPLLSLSPFFSCSLPQHTAVVGELRTHPDEDYVERPPLSLSTDQGHNGSPRCSYGRKQSQWGESP